MDAEAVIRGMAQNVINDFRIREQMQPDIVLDWLKERLEHEFRERRRETLEEAAKVAEEFRDPNPYPTIYIAIGRQIRSLAQPDRDTAGEET